MRQALAGLLWTKQYYDYDVERWLREHGVDPSAPAAPRSAGRNVDWRHLSTGDVLSMPDKWEYPWFAAWDLAFHCVPLALVDADFAKEQLKLLLREWYMHPNGQIPAYEWDFGDVNPPVHAWAALPRLRDRGRRSRGDGDRAFLERVFHKLMLNFTWWVNRKDTDGRNLFEGGFLGPRQHRRLRPLARRCPAGGTSSRPTARPGWRCTAMTCCEHRARAGARTSPAYEDMANKFFEHFVSIADAHEHRSASDGPLGRGGRLLLRRAAAARRRRAVPLRVRSMVGLIPLFAVTTLDATSWSATAGVREAHAVVPREPARSSLSARRRLAASGPPRATAAVAGRSRERLLRDPRR